MFKNKWKRRLEESRNWCLEESASNANYAERFYADKELSEIFWEISKAYKNAAQNIDERLNAK